MNASVKANRNIVNSGYYTYYKKKKSPLRHFKKPNRNDRTLCGVWYDSKYATKRNYKVVVENLKEWLRDSFVGVSRCKNCEKLVKKLLLS
jgi:hypothetical protein